MNSADFADCRVICLVKSVEKIAGNLIFGLKHPFTFLVMILVVESLQIFSVVPPIEDS